MRFLSTLFLFAASSSLCFVPMANAYPFGAGDCPENVAAVGSPHLTGALTGSLEEGGIEVLLDNETLGEDFQGFFTAGVSATSTLRRSEGYKGLLFRLGGDVGTDALQVVEGSNLQISTVCTSVNASGITHTENSIKTESNVTLFVGKEAVALPLDITVVITNNGTSEYYYSALILNAFATSAPSAPGADTEPPTISPSLETPAPVDATTEAPTPAVAPTVTAVTPTAAPVAPTTAPAGNGTAPVGNGTKAPAAAPVPSPVAAPEPAPVASPVAAPVASPVGPTSINITSAGSVNTKSGKSKNGKGDKSGKKKGGGGKGKGYANATKTKKQGIR